MPNTVHRRVQRVHLRKNSCVDNGEQAHSEFIRELELRRAGPARGSVCAQSFKQGQ